MKKKQRHLYLFGEAFTNPYLGNKIIEVLAPSRQRVGWLWQTVDGRIIVSPHLGMYIWFAEGGVAWTKETGAQWLVKNTTQKIEREQ